MTEELLRQSAILARDLGVRPVRRVEFQHAVLGAPDQEGGAHLARGPAAFELDAVRGVGARQLHGRHAALATAALVYLDLGKSLAQEQLGQFQPGILAQREFDMRQIGSAVHHDQVPLGPGGHLDPQVLRIDRRVGRLRPLRDPERIRADRPAGADDFTHAVHHAPYSLMSQS